MNHQSAVVEAVSVELCERSPPLLLLRRHILAGKRRPWEWPSAARRVSTSDGVCDDLGRYIKSRSNLILGNFKVYAVPTIGQVAWSTLLYNISPKSYTTMQWRVEHIFPGEALPTFSIPSAYHPLMVKSCFCFLHFIPTEIIIIQFCTSDFIFLNTIVWTGL